MWILLVVVGALLLTVIVLLATFVVGMRVHSKLVINAVRRLSRASKRLQLKSAGTVGAYASVVRHVGRKSGRQYATPVHVAPAADGFVIALPYGSDSDWVQNVLTQGSATLVYNGGEHQVDHPTVVSLNDLGYLFSSGDRRAHRLFGVENCLVVRRVPRAAAHRAGAHALDA